MNKQKKMSNQWKINLWIIFKYQSYIQNKPRFKNEMNKWIEMKLFGFGKACTHN